MILQIATEWQIANKKKTSMKLIEVSRVREYLCLCRLSSQPDDLDGLGAFG
jgi:hypothetical protein